jgi:hypothetical protein
VKSNLTPAEKAHKEIMQIIMKMFYHKLEPTEKNRLAELAGFYRNGRGPTPKDKKHLPQITDADFETPGAVKALAEKIIGRPIWFTPEKAKPSRKIGAKDKQVQERKAKSAELYTSKVDGKELRPMQIYEEMAAETIDKRDDGRTDADAHDFAIRIAKRDVSDGLKIVEKEKMTSEQAEGIAFSLQHVWNKHTRNHKE